MVAGDQLICEMEDLVNQHSVETDEKISGLFCTIFNCTQHFCWKQHLSDNTGVSN